MEALFKWLSSRDGQNKVLNLNISNVPGPREYGRVGGALVTEIYSVGPLTAGSGLNITVWSYVDQLNVSVLADYDSVDDAHEVTPAMVDEFVEIRRAAGLSEKLTVVEKAMAPVAVARTQSRNRATAAADCTGRVMTRTCRKRAGRGNFGIRDGRRGDLAQGRDEVAALIDRDDRVVGAVQYEERWCVTAYPGDRRRVDVDLAVMSVVLLDDNFCRNPDELGAAGALALTPSRSGRREGHAATTEVSASVEAGLLVRVVGRQALPAPSDDRPPSRR